MNFLKHKPNGNSAKKQWGKRGYPTLFTGRDFLIYVALRLTDHQGKIEIFIFSPYPEL